MGEKSCFQQGQVREGFEGEAKGVGGRNCGGSRGPLRSALLLQLSQSLNDVLLGLEKQHGSNTFTVKAQPRCVRRRAQATRGRDVAMAVAMGGLCGSELGQGCFSGHLGLAFPVWPACADEGTAISVPPMGRSPCRSVCIPPEPSQCPHLRGRRPGLCRELGG